MNVIFLIYKGNNPEVGGHFYSLLSLYLSFSGCEKCIVVIGDRIPEIYNDLGNVFLVSDDRNGKQNLETIYNTLLKMRHTKGASGWIFHAFDLNSACWASILSSKINIPLVVTKAGGRPLRRIAPRFPNMIFFQKSEYIANLNLVENIELIANRVDEKSDPEICLDPYKDRSEQTIRILRIGRFSAYGYAVEKTLLLASRLNSLGKQAEVIFIGQCDDAKDWKNRFAGLSLDVKFLTADKWTIGASKYIQFADVVVGTGRSFMEAARDRKIVCVPSANSKEAVLIDASNFESAFDSNFSDRFLVGKKFDYHQNALRILELIDDAQLRCEYQKFIYISYKKHFHVKGAIPKIFSLYEKSRPLSRLSAQRRSLHCIIYRSLVGLRIIISNFWSWVR